MISTIIFDLSEVYLQGMKGVDIYLQQNYNLPLTENSLLIPELNDLFHGKITENDFWLAVIKTYNLQSSVSELELAVRNNFKEIKGTREIIERLKENGYKLGLLSVHAKEWIDHCEKQYDYHKLFDSVMYSFEVGVSKPDFKAFELILNKLNATAKECLFIDDSIKNIDAAKKIGMNIIQFQSPIQLKTDLNKLGISIN